MTASRVIRIHTTNAELRASAAPRSHAPIKGVDLWYAPLALLKPKIEEHLALLDDHEQARAQRFLYATDRERYIAGHGLMRIVLGRYLDHPPQDVVMLRGEFGKPYVPDHPVHFNLSDTKDAVLVAVAMEPIGADIETMIRSTDHERVAEHYFTANEVASIATAPDHKRRFLELWTRKEAVLKASGVGLMDDLKSLDVGAALNTMTIRHPDFVRMVTPVYHVYTLHVGKDHLVSIAASRPIADLRLIEDLPR